LIDQSDEASLTVAAAISVTLCVIVVPLETPPVSSPLLPATPVMTPSQSVLREFGNFYCCYLFCDFFLRLYICGW